MICRYSARSVALMLVMTLLFLGAVPAASLGVAETLGVDLEGRPVHELGGPGIRFVVLVFAASDCPISNRYVPEIARLSQEFASRGVRIWWVFPNAGDTAAVVSQHNHDFAIKEDTILDREQNLVRLAHARVTPEAAMFAVQGSRLNEIYQGRIDDRYQSIGQERPQPDHHDLEDAIRAALAGRNIPRSSGPPVGCSIEFLMQ
jgi:hypothetical protein